MIATQIPQSQQVHPAWHQDFLDILPQINQQLDFAFRHLDDEAREEAIQEGVVHCCAAYKRLVQQDRIERAFPSALARFAIKRVKAGRPIGTRRNVKNPLSRFCQLQKGCKVERLERLSKRDGEWVPIMVEDRRTPVPDQAAFRVDVPRWLSRLACRTRKIARDLAMGWSSVEIARKHGLSRGRISQIRKRMYESWNEFHGVMPDTTAAVC